MITIIAIGKKHESWIQNGVERYQKRCRQPWSFQWTLLPHSTKDEAQARLEESERILARLRLDDFVIVLDERGRLLDSPSLAQATNQAFTAGKTPVFIIGGAYGVSDSVRQRANLVWSLSPLVFPHQLVRLILAEQLYRAQEISRNHPYHHA